MLTVRISEIFASIQGESSYAGRPCVFVRTAGCNLRCDYCDTTYAYDGGRRMGIDEVLTAVSGYGVDLVEVTGGEPLHQEHVPLLIEALLDAGYTTLVETNGSYDISVVDDRAIRIVDVKCPGSGMSDRVNWACLEHLKSSDQVKFVISDREDYLWSKKVVEERGLAGAVEILFSPVHGALAPEALAGWILEDRLPVRLQLQLHKYIWDEHGRGV
jgi:7-carboxy-7-deazaguanine synthase